MFNNPILSHVLCKIVFYNFSPWINSFCLYYEFLADFKKLDGLGSSYRNIYPSPHLKKIRHVNGIKRWASLLIKQNNTSSKGWQNAAQPGPEVPLTFSLPIKDKQLASDPIEEFWVEAGWHCKLVRPQTAQFKWKEQRE